jgi:elongation factor P
MVRAELRPRPIRCARPPQPQSSREPFVRVIASSLRKGNILDMRRISDGVKTTQRYKTTEQVERAYVEDREHTFLYQDGDGFHFMNAETYDQITVSGDIVGDQAAYLEPEMKVKVSLHEGVPLAIELPQRAVLAVVETEPTVKGQTASSSYKPAVLSNGVRTMVPPHIATGTRIVVMTADGSYVERAKE